MGKINVLGFEIANLIAAGEVVDRPASVLKELLENAIDAGATRITAEIRAGGVTMIRVADNGHGIAAEDLPVAIRRHATSKIKTAEDLAAIGTLGFRGEALAAIAAVSEVRILTKPREAEVGMMLVSSGGNVTEISEVGTANGTTVLVENLFANLPARRKFLKKDATETMASTAVVEKIALSRPDISFEWITDGITRFKTAGDGELLHTLYALQGREFASRLLPVSGESGGIAVSGYVGTSDNVRPNRNHQNVFINGRYVKSKTVMAALEKAYTSYIAPEKFPVSALFLTVNPLLVDVNVHPAKLEVKFSDERVVFEAVYYAVRHALEENAARPEWQFAPQKKQKSPLSAFLPVGERERVGQIAVRLTPTTEKPAPAVPVPPKTAPASDAVTVRQALSRLQDLRAAGEHIPPLPVETMRLASDDAVVSASPNPPLSNKIQRPFDTNNPAPSAAHADEPAADTPTREAPPYRIAGEVFRCYIIVEREKELLLIDKHAAHERLLFEELKAKRQADGRVGSQALLVPLTLSPAEGEWSAAEEYRAELEAVGFAYQTDSAARRIHITAVPDAIALPEAEDLFIHMAAELYEGAGNPRISEAMRRERLLYRVACRAAMKGGRLYGDAQIEWLVDRILSLPDITVCPHGRPVAIRMTKNQLDRQFDRIG